MINWRECSYGGFRFEVPERLRQMGVLPLFKGKVTRGQLDTELIVTFNPDVSPYIVSQAQQASTKPPFTGSGEFKCVYHFFGPSKIREGGFEDGTTQTASNPLGRGRAHHWGIVFPVHGRWVELDITNGFGGLEWEEFEEIGRRIIQSVAAI